MSTLLKWCHSYYSYANFLTSLSTICQVCPDQGLRVRLIRQLALSLHAFYISGGLALKGLEADFSFQTMSGQATSLYRYPKESDLVAFRIPSNCFVKLHAGTWHAGPLFPEPDNMSFYNLELADTNVVDHNTHKYSKDGIVYELQEQ